MCMFCDALEQWVCDCGAVVALGRPCECGRRRDASHDESETVEVVFFGLPNRASRRRRK